MNQIVSYLLTATLSSTPTGEIGDVTEQFEKNVEKLPEFLDKFYEGAEQFDDITELSIQFKKYYVAKQND